MSRPAGKAGNRRVPESSQDITLSKPVADQAQWSLLAPGLAVVISAVTCGAFLGILANGFVALDDQENFLNNVDFRGLGLAQLQWAWSTRLLGVYQPLAWILLEAQYVAFGLQPIGYHAVSIVLHALNAALFFYVITAVLSRIFAKADRTVLVMSALAALLWAVHPLRVEVVAWASCQPYLPCTTFLLGSVLTYLQASTKPIGSRGWLNWYITSLVLFLAAGLFKAPAMTLPVVLIILDFYPLRRISAKLWSSEAVVQTWAEKTPYFVISIVIASSALWGREHSARRVVSSIFERFMQPAYGLGFYLLKTVMPLNLTPENFVPEPFGPFDTPFVVAAVALVLVVAAVIYIGPRYPGVATAWAIYAVVVSPNLGFLPIGEYLVADRYSYLATMSFFALGAGAMTRLARVGRQILIQMVVGAATVALIGQTWAQCRVWHDSQSLWSHDLALGSAREAGLKTNLGAELYHLGKIQEGLKFLREAADLQPDLYVAQTNLAKALVQQGRFAEAETYAAKAVQLQPNDSEARHLLGLAVLRQNRIKEAEVQLREAIRLASGPKGTSTQHLPNGISGAAVVSRGTRSLAAVAEMYDQLGIALSASGRFDDAVREFSEASRRQPNWVEPHIHLGISYARLNRLNDAETEFATAVRVDPKRAEAHGGLGAALAGRNDDGDAIKHLSEAIRLAPKQSSIARGNLGVVLARQGQVNDAIAQFQEAIRLDPSNVQARRGLEEIQNKIRGESR
jgi:protein O-mannosyl-transferase